MKQDNGGISRKLNSNVELRANIDWNEIYNMIKDSDCIDIATYSQYEADDFWQRLKDHKNVNIVINEKSLYNVNRTLEFKAYSASHDVAQVDNSHAKMILAAPDFVCLSSQNVGSADWLQNTIIFYDKEAYDFYKCQFDSYAKDGWVNNYKGKSISDTASGYVTAEKGNESSWGRSVVIMQPAVKLEKMLNWKTKVTGIWYKDVFISTFTLPNKEYVKDTLEILLKNGNHVTVLVNSQSAIKLEKIRNELTEKLEDSFINTRQRGKYICAAMRLKHIMKENKLLFDIEVRSNIHAKVLMAGKDKLTGGGKEVVWLSSQNLGTSGWFENMVGIYGTEAYEFYSEIFREFLNKEE